MKSRDQLIRRHLSAGWIGIFIFLVLGLALELLHGFKVSWYLAVDNETRRFLWVLAHAHGALIALLNILFGLSLRRLPQDDEWFGWISVCLLAALVLMPTGFLTGGIVIYQGDPGPGIALALLGAGLLIAGTGAFAWKLLRQPQ